jgi:hypothetical protein
MNRWIVSNSFGGYSELPEALMLNSPLKSRISWLSAMLKQANREAALVL